MPARVKLLFPSSFFAFTLLLLLSFLHIFVYLLSQLAQLSPCCSARCASSRPLHLLSLTPTTIRSLSLDRTRACGTIPEHQSQVMAEHRHFLPFQSPLTLADIAKQADAVFSGISTFGRLPYWPCLADDSEKYDIAFLGACPCTILPSPSALTLARGTLRHRNVLPPRRTFRP